MIIISCFKKSLLIEFFTPA